MAAYVERETPIKVACGAMWSCCRIRAGPLVKECRALRPRFRPGESRLDHRAKSDIKQYLRAGINRSPVDRLEIRLALLGPQGAHYILTFDDDHLPRSYEELRRVFRAFLVRVARYRDGRPLDYVYRIEGLHGDHRYHIHFACPYSNLSPAEIAYLWRQGHVDDEPVLRIRRCQDPASGKVVSMSEGGYRRLAEYLYKERIDGASIPIGKHPWGCSRSLNAKVPPLEVWTDSTNAIQIPDDVIWARRPAEVRNDFGAYYYATWIENTH